MVRIVDNFPQNIRQKRVVETEVDRLTMYDLFGRAMVLAISMATFLVLLPPQRPHDIIRCEEHAVHGGKSALLGSFLPVVRLLELPPRRRRYPTIRRVRNYSWKSCAASVSGAMGSVEVRNELGHGHEAVVALGGSRHVAPAVVRRAQIQSGEPSPRGLIRLDDYSARVHQQGIDVIQADDVAKVDLKCAHTAQRKAMRLA
mmetsp:Transcript_16202/g.46920  ORF Transcript_16202/g.46920 Transcript_16202/m.46920 type:complete len:201 (+) Transcript_16202:1211-1813(+)